MKNSGLADWGFAFTVCDGDFNAEKFIMAVNAKDDGRVGNLYYRYFDGSPNPTTMQINYKSFNEGGFNSTSDGGTLLDNVDLNYNLDSQTKVEREFVAMAANEDGVFIAEKELEYPSSFNNTYYTKYNIIIKKYPKQGANYDSPLASIDIVGKSNARVATNMFGNAGTFDNANANWDEYVKETISDMYTYNGVLYALSCKRIGGMVIIPPDPMSGSSVAVFKKADVSGAMWKIWNNTKDAEGVATKVFEKKSDNKKINGGFSPRHFVGILPNMLVVASDDYYCWSENDGTRFAKNYDSAFCFILRDAGVTMDKEQEVKVHFSFNYATNQGNSTSDWIWKN